MSNLLTGLVDQQYTYENLHELLRLNIVPVCMETISADGCTLPPKPSKQRGSGRPKKQRIRKRKRWAYDPERPNIGCSGCQKRGHNIRTCMTRSLMGEDSKNGKPQPEVDKMNDLDLS